MNTRCLNCEFTMPAGFYHFDARPPLRAFDPGQEANQPRVYVPGRVLSWYGTQTIKAPGVELLVHLVYRPFLGTDDDAFLIWSGHQMFLQSGANNTVVIQSPVPIPAFGPGWVWVVYESIAPDSGPESNMMWEVQLVIFHT